MVRPKPPIPALQGLFGKPTLVNNVLTLAAVPARVIPLRLGVAVAVIGAVGPFVGSYEFVREERRRRTVLQ